MRKPFKIIVVVIVAAVCSKPVMLGVQHMVLPAGERWTSFSVLEPFAAPAPFALFLCACAGLAAAVGCYLRGYSAAVRWTIVLLPMLVAGGFATLLKAAELRDAQFAAALFGLPVTYSVRQAALYMIPAIAFAAGLLAVTVLLVLHPRRFEGAGDTLRGQEDPVDEPAD